MADDAGPNAKWRLFARNAAPYKPLGDLDATRHSLALFSNKYHTFTHTNMTTKNVIVFGGTGHQGSGFVRALAAHNSPSAAPAYTIHVLNRNPNHATAAKLAQLTGVKIVHSPLYMDAPDEAFDAAGLEVGDVHGAFMVNGYMNAEKEVAQGGSNAECAEPHYSGELS